LPLQTDDAPGDKAGEQGNPRERINGDPGAITPGIEAEIKGF
jgi:hypothetical protein